MVLAFSHFCSADYLLFVNKLNDELAYKIIYYAIGVITIF